MQAARMPMTLVCAAALALPAAGAAAPALYMNNLAPFIYTDGGVRRGVIYEQLEQMARRNGDAYDITPLPFNRIVAQLDSAPDTLAVMWRLPENETRYQWIVKLFEDKMVLAVRNGSRFDISSAQAAATLRVGVVLGSPAEVIARRLNFAHVEATASAESNARKLAMGRIDAWIAVPAVIAQGQAAIGGAMGDLRLGGKIADVSLYLSCSRRCDGVDLGSWREAAEQMRKDGSRERILRRYRYQPP
jgi:polar amino acid transport system substrate-binding protein